MGGNCRPHFSYLQNRIPLYRLTTEVVGRVACSSAFNPARASSREPRHMSSEGRKLTQNAGRSGRPKIPQRRSGKSWTHGIPAGLPPLMPGIGVVMLGAIQHAPQPERQSMPGASSSVVAVATAPVASASLPRVACHWFAAAGHFAAALNCCAKGCSRRSTRDFADAPTEHSPEEPSRFDRYYQCANPTDI